MKVQNDGIRTTITAQQTKKRSEFFGPRKHTKTVQICTPEHYEQILMVFSRFLGPANSDLTSGTLEQLEFSLLLRFFKIPIGEPGS